MKVWLTHGPEAAELVGVSRPAQLFTDPAKQAALEKALKECKPSKASAEASISKRQRQGGASAAQPWQSKAICRHCRERGHFARDCPNGRATQLGPRPPM